MRLAASSEIGVPPSRFTEFGLSLDIPISHIEVGNHEWQLPMIKPSHLHQHLADLGKLSLLYADEDPSILQQFWYRHRQIEPQNTIHDYFGSSALDPSRTIPLLLHGDEGRGRKHKPVMVINTHSWIGLGSRPYNRWHEEAPVLKRQTMGVNMQGSSVATRFLALVLPQKAYGKDSIYLDRMLAALSADLTKLQTIGVLVQGERWRLAVVGATGDLQWFCKAGRLVRSYNRVSKRSGQKSHGGICYLCLAGTPEFKFDCFADNPSWLPSVGLEDPWVETPDFIRRFHVNNANPADFFKPDVWHCLHLGLGKIFLANSFVEWLPHLPGTFSDKASWVSFVWVFLCVGSGSLFSRKLHLVFLFVFSDRMVS